MNSYDNGRADFIRELGEKLIPFLVGTAIDVASGEKTLEYGQGVVKLGEYIASFSEEELDKLTGETDGKD